MNLPSIPVYPKGFRLNAHRVIPVESDAMEPLMKAGDFLFVAQCSQFEFDGIYIVDDGYGGEDVYRVTGIGGSVILSRDNPLYGKQEMTRTQFAAAVTGMVIGRCEVLDHQAFRDLIEAGFSRRSVDGETPG